MFSDRRRSVQGATYSPPLRAKNQKLLQRRHRKFSSLENFQSEPSIPSTASGHTTERDAPMLHRNHPVDSRATSQEDDDDDDEEAEHEEVLTDLQHHHAKHRRGKLVTFYRNGDPHFRGLRTSVSRKMFATLGTLLAWLNDKISTEHGVKCIFSLPDGSMMRDISQFVGGRSYVVSSVRRIIHVPYGDGKERFWRNRSVEKLTPDLKSHQPMLPARQSWQQLDKVPAPYTNRGGRMFEKASGPYTTRDARVSDKGSPWQTPTEVASPLTGRDKGTNPRRQRDEGTSRIEPITSRDPIPTSHIPLALSIRLNPPPLLPSPAAPLPHSGSEHSSSKTSSPISSRGEYFQPKATAKPRILVIRSNTDRGSRQKVIFNPYTSQSYEDVLLDVKNMVDIKYPPVTALYTAKPPFVKVMGLSHLARDLKDCDEFIACGREGVPVEQQSSDGGSKPNPDGRGAPSSSSDTGRDSMRPSQSLDRLDSGAVSYASEYGSADESRSRKTFRVISKPSESKSKPVKTLPPRHSDVKRVHIHGQMREFFRPVSGDRQDEPSKLSKKLSLNWVYGYRGRDIQKNLFVLPSGELLYSVGAVAVLFDKGRESQRHYREHIEDIMCMDVHSEGNEAIVATGQLSGKSSETRAHVRIWNSRSLKTYAVLGKDLMLQSVNSVAFSKKSGNCKDHSFVVAIDGGEKHMMTIWDWRNQSLLAKTNVATESTSLDLVTSASFHPEDHRIIVTYGSQHINFWKLLTEGGSDSENSQARILRDKESGQFEAGNVPSYVTSLAYGSNGDVITGNSGGQIIVWNRNENDVFQIDKRATENLRNSHKKPILSLVMLQDGILLSGAGSDIRAWDSKDDFRLVKERTLPEGTVGSVRTVAPVKRGGIDGAFYVGLTSNVVLLGSLQNKFSSIIQGHSEELWAVAAHPSDQTIFATAGYDQFVCQWNALKHSLVWKVQVEKPCVSIDYDPSGRRLVIGTTVGRFIVLNSENGHHIVSMQVGTESLDAVKFSTDGQFLAVGCQNGNIYIFDVLDNCQVYRKHNAGVLKGHQNMVSHLDWSTTGHNLRSVSGDYDLLLWNVDSMEPISASSAGREITWSSQSCTLGYEALGPWSELKEGEDINAMTRSSSSTLLAVGNNKGTVSLYSYPCVNGGESSSVQEKICSGNVTHLAFTSDDRFLVTSGGVDASVVQWSLVSDRE